MLERPEPLGKLLEAVRGADRLVLLGDTVELRDAHPEQAMATAVPILTALGAATEEVVVVPGNHDRLLVRDWIRRRGDHLGLEDEVPPDASPHLERLTRALGNAGAQVTVRYPGVELAPGVWATHGHYLDRHLWPVSPYGLVRGGRAAWRTSRRSPPARAGARPVDYERAGWMGLGPVVRWLPAPGLTLVEDAAELLRAATMPRIHPGISPVTAALLGLQMRRHSLPALAQVLARLGIGHEHVVFGHVHRRGPLPGDRLADWRGPSGTPRLVNCGCWRYEPLLLHHAHPTHPYWPGGAVLLEDGGPPRAVGLLDHLTDDHIRIWAR